MYRGAVVKKKRETKICQFVKYIKCSIKEL